MPATLPSERIAALVARAARAAGDDPPRASQVALGYRGEIVAFETAGRARFGGEVGAVREAGAHTLFSIYSVTKAVTSAASWILLQEGKLALDDPVARHVPEFGGHGKHGVTVEQLLTHTAGFPSARLPTRDWPDPARRLRHFASWPLEWEPGSRFAYHATSTMWVLAELVTRLGGVDYRDFIRTRICEPLGLADLHIGLPPEANGRVADVVAVGEAMSADERAASPVDAPVVDGELLDHANDPANRAIGSPAGGGIATAADLARFYQGLLADAEGRGAGIWRPEMLRDAWTVRSPHLVDPMTGQPALRGLGVVIAGERERMWRGFCDGCSPRAFGHMGAGGQVAWADPASGLSFAFLTSGAERNVARQGANGFRLSTLAAACAPEPTPS